MSTLGKYQNSIIGAVLVVAAFFAYSYFFTGSPDAALSSSTPSGTVTVDQDLIGLLSTLKTIKLDSGLFSEPSFQSLQDFSRALTNEPVGRTNPFEPLK